MSKNVFLAWNYTNITITMKICKKKSAKHVRGIFYMFVWRIEFRKESHNKITKKKIRSKLYKLVYNGIAYQQNTNLLSFALRVENGLEKKEGKELDRFFLVWKED